ncbi:MAG: sensor histidine kinase [Bacillota bacterium]
MMDSKTSMLLMLAKYGGYIATLWVTVSNWGLSLDGPLTFLLLLFTVDSIRQYFMETRWPGRTHTVLWVELVLVYLFLWADGTGIGSILFVVLIAESQLTHSRTIGGSVFLLSLVGFLLISGLRAWFLRESVAERLMNASINSLFFFFAFGVSLLARMQREERDRAESALRQLERSQSELEEAHRRLMESSRQRERMAAIEERNRLAREIHDTVAHSLTGIIVGLEASTRLMEVDPDQAAEGLVRIQQQARMGLQEIRRSVKAWKPQDLEAVGFEAAVRGLAHEISGAGLHVDLDMEEFCLPEHLELPFYRMIQEGITNSVRHGRARRMYIQLRQGASSIILTLRDDGSGTEGLAEGYGLRGMRERIEGVGGTIEFGNAEPRGFLIRAQVEVTDCGHPDTDCR